MAGSDKPVMYYDVPRRAWLIKGKSGDILYQYGEDEATANRIANFTKRVDMESGIVVGGGTDISKITHVVGSSADITSVGSGLTALGTISVTGAVVGDVVVISPKKAPGTNINIGLAWVPSVNTVNFQVQQNADTEGSFVAVGWDVLLIGKT